jgi:hypothetical protein
MKKLIIFVVAFICMSFLKAQLTPVENPYQSSFNQAYLTYPEIPKGLLEAISFQQTRMTHLAEDMPVSCTGMPQYLGVMGLIENGENYFNENLHFISLCSGIDVQTLKTNPHHEIMAFAKTYHDILLEHHALNESIENKLWLLQFITEIPLRLQITGNNYAFDTYLYGLIQFLNNSEMQTFYGFYHEPINERLFFGEAKWNILSARIISVYPDHIENELHDTYVISSSSSEGNRTADYGPALWNPAAACNYSSRAGVPISAVTVHTVQGSYSGCISWFQNCAASVSAHYVMRSSDGQVTQQVLESNKAWHVGSENPYTVGIEHEGFVNNPAWYTTAMYNSSAALSADIATSYGIDKIRTGWWPWMASTIYANDGIPGTCVKIKGHQHYPNQSHVDPGVNWDWNRYFKLIHPTPAATMITTASGNFYDSGGSGGNYLDDERIITTIAPLGAATVTITFNSFNLENTWDYLYIYDGADINSPLIGYYTGTSNPGTITSSAGVITFEFRSDCSTQAPGWQAVFTSNSAPNSGDSIPPVTALNILNTWQTTDFDAQFTDADEMGGSGLKKSYYHVSYFNGTGHYANSNRGFFRDEFDLPVLNSQWTLASGTWNLNSGVIEQTDEASSNTNMFASLKQDLSNIYMYEFSAAIGGVGTNRRAGFHFFCDSAQLTNRGNSYFVWFRVDQQTLEIYKVVNDVFTLEHTVAMTIAANQWYNYKVFFDRITGVMRVYQDNILIGEWTDTSPYNTGKYISFRSGNANFKVNNIKVYRSRYSNSATNIIVGNCLGCDLLFQNPTPSIPAGAIYSFSEDSSNNLSAFINEDVNIDWTPPAPLYYINDFSILDEDTITTNLLAGGNWNIAADTNSAISSYYYCIGTTPGDSNVVNWQDNWFYTNFTDTITLITNQWYYITAKSENGAGLVSNVFSSDGFIYVNLGMNEENSQSITVYPNPANQFIYLNGFTEFKDYLVQWTSVNGSIIKSQNHHIHSNNIVLEIPSELSSGIYLLQLRSTSKSYTIRVEVLR